MKLKMMGAENLPDADNRKTHIFLDDVASVFFTRTGTAAEAEVFFLDGTREVFELKGNAYLLNDNGKTVDSFGVSAAQEPEAKLTDPV